MDYFVGRFSAMGSPCEVLIDTLDETVADEITEIVASEAKRIEHKFSRYQINNIIHKINSGNKTIVDDETASLLDYAEKLFDLSDSLFDITAGVLRLAWKFDGSSNIPEQADIDSLLPFIGWRKLKWENPEIKLPAGMEIDLGGIGKEYAVDRSAQLVRSYLHKQSSDHYQVSALLNFGGDITALPPINHQGRSWTIGIDTGIDGHILDNQNSADHTIISLISGGVATSGDSKRFLIKDHKRYGHILDPRTGWPVEKPPASVTVAAETCTDAGMLSTLALLHGSEAETFLNEQGVDYWLRW